MRKTLFDEQTYRITCPGVDCRAGAAERHWWFEGRHAGKKPFYIPPALFRRQSPAPRFSIIMLLNQTLQEPRRTINSILNQSASSLELFLVDITERTPVLPPDLLEVCLSDPHVQLFACPGLSAPQALNTVLPWTSGEFVTWLTSEVTFEQDALAELARTLERHREAVLVYSDWRQQTRSELRTYRVPDFSRPLLSREWYVGCVWAARMASLERSGSFTDTFNFEHLKHLELAELGPFSALHAVLGTWHVPESAPACLGDQRAPAVFDGTRYFAQHPDAIGFCSAANRPAAESHWWQAGRRQGYLPLFRLPREIERQQTPSVSVVMPVYNAAAYLADAIRSVLDQTERDLELILVDDGSTDSSPEIIWEAMCADQRVIGLAKRNGGTGSALNLGFQYAAGEFQTWYAADSTMRPTALVELKSALLQKPEAVMAYSDWAIYKQATGELIEQPMPEFDKYLLRRFCMVGNTWLFRRTAKEQAGPYMEEICEDYDMHLRLSEIGPFVHVAKVLGMWRDHSANLSSTRAVPQNWQQSVRAAARHVWRCNQYKVLSFAAPSLVAPWFLAQGINRLSRRFAMRHAAPRGACDCLGQDLLLPGQMKEVQQLLAESDLVHIHVAGGRADHLPRELFALCADRNIPMLMHFYGVIPPGLPADLLGRIGQAAAFPAYEDPEMANGPGGAVWLPPLLPLGAPHGFIDQKLFTPDTGWPAPGPSLRIICDHADLERQGLPGLQELARLVEEERAGIPGCLLTLRTLERIDYAANLRDKKTHHLCIDQLHGGYLTMSGWEALAQGLVVLAHISPPALQMYRQLGDGEPPPVINVDDLRQLPARIAAFLDTPEDLIRVARESRQWMLAHYDAKRILKLYEGAYERVLTQKAGRCGVQLEHEQLAH